jgi:large subunit ribosomal protein L18
MRIEKKLNLLWLRRRRIRKKVTGSQECPRMSVRFTGQNIYIQFVDDIAKQTLVATSTRGKGVPDRDKLVANKKSAEVMGRIAAETALAKGIKTVVFDRSGGRFHGKIKALADAARKAGLIF